MASNITTPDFNYAKFYYPEILQDLIQYWRQNMPELNDEDPVEPLQQLLRAFAYAAHNNNVHLDMVAKERFLPTASLRESVRAQLSLIGVELAQATPASGMLLLELTQPFTIESLAVPVLSQFASTGNAEASGILFEALTALTVPASTTPQYVRSYDASEATWTEHIPGTPFTPWAGTPTAGDLLYVGHSGVLWNELAIDIEAGSTGISAGVWEYYDGNYNDATPDTDSVVNNGSDLTLSLNTWLGTSDRTGTVVRVKCLVTGRYADALAVYYSGGVNKVDTPDLLGQSTPSLTADDYIVGSLWNPLQAITDDTAQLSVGDEHSVTYRLPQSVSENWITADVGASGDTDNAYWIRYRVTAANGATAPTINNIDITAGKQYVLVRVTQGQTETDTPLGSSTGDPGQRFALTSYPVIDDTSIHVFVTEGLVESEWVRVDNFLNSSAISKHYVVLFDNDGRAIIEFGDGTNGKIPQSGVDNIRASYRTLPVENGNLGPGAITVNRSGLGYVNAVTNPRTMAGYRVAEGSTEDDLARVKIAGPASIRVQSRGVTAADIVNLTTSFIDSYGVAPFARALAVEEAYGLKTVQVVVAGTGSGAVELDTLAELETYFNGTGETEAGVLLLNSQLTAVNFTAHAIDITATVYGGNATAIENALAALLSPTAQTENGDWEWEFGEEVPVSRVIAAIMATTPAPRKVTLSTPAADVALATNELPTAGTITLTIV